MALVNQGILDKQFHQIRIRRLLLASLITRSVLTVGCVIDSVFENGLFNNLIFGVWSSSTFINLRMSSTILDQLQSSINLELELVFSS